MLTLIRSYHLRPYVFGWYDLRVSISLYLPLYYLIFIVLLCFVQIWPQVKAANPHLSSVCEIGAVIGGLWRELGPEDKQRYNDQFTKDKVGGCASMMRY